MPGIQFELPVPDGYCQPSGLGADTAQIMAAGDTVNVTHLTLVRCGASEDAFSDYYLIKTPSRVLLAVMDRETFLDSMGEVFASTEVAQLLESGSIIDQSEEAMSQVIGRQIDLAGAIQPLGRDDVCAYLGGTMQVQMEELAYSISVAACLTTVSSRILAIYSYGPDSGAASIAGLMLRSKRVAMSIVGTTAH